MSDLVLKFTEYDIRVMEELRKEFENQTGVELTENQFIKFAHKAEEDQETERPTPTVALMTAMHEALKKRKQFWPLEGGKLD